MSKTFIKITNQDIYDQLIEIANQNTIQHNKMINHQIRTNGKVKLNRTLIGLIITGLLAIGGVLASHLLGI